MVYPSAYRVSRKPGTTECWNEPPTEEGRRKMKESDKNLATNQYSQSPITFKKKGGDKMKELFTAAWEVAKFPPVAITFCVLGVGIVIKMISNK